MLGQIISRRHAIRCLGATFALAGVAGCVPGASGVAASGSIASGISTMTPAQVAAEGSIVLAGVSGAVAAFIATNPSGVPAATRAKVALAEGTAMAAVNTLGAADLSSVPAAAVSIANTIVSVTTMVPGLPPAVVAGAVAFQVLATALEPLLDGQVPLGVTLQKTPGIPGVGRVFLVPNH
jgi:hypothetical protein